MNDYYITVQITVYQTCPKCYTENYERIPCFRKRKTNIGSFVLFFFFFPIKFDYKNQQ